ncbi:TPA: hypothetical protein R5X29_001206 [Enterobacter sichuanensis]|nr:hypothetical protein [Enterobacter sichuanensis]
MNEAGNIFQLIIIMVTTMNFYKKIDVVIKFLKVNLTSILSFLLGGISALCFVKTDKVSDSISALANVVMAFAAILGLVFAKKWKRDATKDKVIERSIQILSVHLLDINKYFVPVLHINVFQFWFSSFVEKVPTTYKFVRSMKKMATNYLGSIEKESEVYTKFVSEIEYIKLLSWDIKKEHREVVDAIQLAMKNIIAKDQELLALINTIFGMWNISVYNSDESKAYTELPLNLSNSPIVQMAISLIPDMVREREDLHKLLEDMLSKQLNVFSFVEQVEH